MAHYLKPTQDHPLVKLFNYLKSIGQMSQFKDYDDYLANRDRKKQEEPKMTISLIEAQAKAEIAAASEENKNKNYATRK